MLQIFWLFSPDTLLYHIVSVSYFTHLKAVTMPCILRAFCSEPFVALNIFISTIKTIGAILALAVCRWIFVFAQWTACRLHG